jgi:hypothetical protein
MIDLETQEARLTAQRDGADTISLPKRIAARSGDPKVVATLTGQQRIFADQAATLAKQTDVWRSLSPGGAFLDIVPSKGELVIEARVQPLDIDVVHRGLKANVRFVAFKQRTTPTLDGEVTRVGRCLHRRALRPVVLHRDGACRRGRAQAPAAGQALFRNADRGCHHHRQSAKQTASQRALEILDVRRQVRQQVTEPWNLLLAATSTIGAARVQVEANRLALEGVQQERQGRGDDRRDRLIEDTVSSHQCSRSTRPISHAQHNLAHRAATLLNMLMLAYH